MYGDEVTKDCNGKDQIFNPEAATKTRDRRADWGCF
jgi:hypothetical protein